MEQLQKPPSGAPQGRQKMNYACEACRAAKTRCQSGPQPDICKRCSEFKRECIFRTGPRTRRPKAASRIDPEASGLPPPPGPSKTFSIDFAMPAAEEPNDDFERLREQHERILEGLVLNSSGDEDEQQQQQQVAEDMARVFSGSSNPGGEPQTFSFNDMSSSPSASRSGTGSSRTESSSAAAGLPAEPKSKPMLNLGIKPQFNLDSAMKLLASFGHMLPHMPCLVLPDDPDVRSLARRSPFVLLAILAVTSCSSSLQGHSLYDEEFRKVLGLKFVAGGERSLELLQGILIYCAWYPFHLRPKNKQSFQYLRMAVDIVHDLEMEQDPDLDLSSLGPEQRAHKLANTRALLGCFYAMSSFSATWNRASTMRYTPQLARSVEWLERHSELAPDRHLAWLVRLQYVFEELVEVHRNFERGPRDHQSEMQRNLMRVGLEAQFRDFKARMPPQYASTTSVLLVSEVTEAMMLAPALLRMPRKLNGKDTVVETIPADRLLQAAHKVRAVFDHVAALTARSFGGFCGADYGRFIVAVILAYRLSFPLLSICRDYNVARGRRILDLGGVLRKLVGEDEGGPQADGDASATTTSSSSSSSPPQRGAAAAKRGYVPGAKKPARKSDAVSALKVVLRSVKCKYEEKSAAFEAMSAAATGEEFAARDFRSTCPMLNGSMDQYIPLWAGQQQQQQQSGGSYATSQTSSSGVTTGALSGDMGLDPGTQFVGPMGQMGLGVGVGVGVGAFEDKPLMYHDLWTSMTMGWAGDMGEVNMEDIGTTGYGELLDQM
ncbi:hypothetical protein F5X98DRAFT_306702 [Xylaria grammica]|nr:hypothetical protein F5X98DRAFT_306702 [Xylaria grammica]